MLCLQIFLHIIEYLILAIVSWADSGSRCIDIGPGSSESFFHLAIKGWEQRNRRGDIQNICKTSRKLGTWSSVPLCSRPLLCFVVDRPTPPVFPSPPRAQCYPHGFFCVHGPPPKKKQCLLRFVPRYCPSDPLKKGNLIFKCFYDAKSYSC